MNIKDLGSIMSKAKEMQTKLKEAQNEIDNLSIEGESGAGLVKVTMTGRKQVTNVVLDESLLKENKSLIEDLVGAAFNDASNKTDNETKDRMKSAQSAMPFDLDMLKDKF